MNKLYKSIAIFLASFMFFMHPLALIATEVGVSTSSSSNITSRIPSTFTFTEDMYNGYNSDQVKMLQIFLNSDTRTIVNTTGPGSPSNETTYYGNATQNAVERFQTIYKAEILEPLGLSSPTGLVGSRTRSILNQILTNSRNGQSNNTGTTSSISRSNQNTSTSTTVTTANTVNNIVFLNSQNLQEAYAGIAYANIIIAQVNKGSYTWQLVSGSLPNGISFDQNNTYSCTSPQCYLPIKLSGTPTSASSYTFAVKVSSATSSATAQFSLNVKSSDEVPSSVTNILQQNYSNSNSSSNSSNSIIVGTSSSSETTYSSSTGSSSSSSNLTTGLVALGAVVGVSAAVSAVSSASKLATSAALPGFGGRVVFIQYCTCTGMILLYVFNPLSVTPLLPVMYVPGVSTLHKNYNVFTAGPQVLGGYIYVTLPCLFYVGVACVPIGFSIGTIDTIRGVGTSAI